MAKISGLGMSFWLSGYDLGGNVHSLDKVHGKQAVFDVTDITQSAFERRGGVRDGEVSFTVFYDTDANMSHARLSPLPTTDVLVQTNVRNTAGYPAAAMIGRQVGYDGTRNDKGEFTLKVQALADNYGLEWGNLLTDGKVTDTEATDHTGIDLTDVSTLYGWQAYAQVFAVTGTSVTLTLQDSANDIAYASLAGGAFTAVTPAAAPAWQRLAGGASAEVRRYVRVASSGTFSSATFGVMFVRNRSAVTF